MMLLTNTLQQTTLFSSNDFTMPEHFGDDRWTILHGDVMHIVPHMTRAVFDAVITDPPYASGGASQTAKNRSTTEKYSSLRGDKALPDFDSDQMDQRSWTGGCVNGFRWCVLPASPARPSVCSSTGGSCPP